MKVNFHKLLLGIFIAALFGTSCTTQKKMIYLQGAGSTDSTSEYTNQMANYKIHSGDVLSIRIISLNKEITPLFNVEPENNYNIYNDAALYFRGYTVNELGKIVIPVIGEIDALGLTLEELQVHVQQKVDEMLKDAQVIVKFGGFKFTVLGEVKRPGMFYIYNNRLSLLEAIGEAGDLTDYGNRENILIVRPTQSGSKTFRVNLLDKNILQNPGFYLTPNDVVYVEPVKTKNWKLNASNVSIILSSITTLILVLNFINLRL